MADAARRHRGVWRFYQFLGAWLVLRFAWAVLVPGDEWPLPPAHYIAMGFDLLLLLAVVCLRSRLVISAEDPRSSSFANLVLVAGVVSGLGLIGIRFTSEPAWWTGHFSNNGFF